MRQQSIIDSAAWNVFARHQPYYHVLSDPRMLNPGAEAQEEFWASGDRDVRHLMEFGRLSFVDGVGVDFGCGLGRLTKALTPFTDTQVGIDISTEMVARAKALHAGHPALDFRAIEGIDWPITSDSASLVISLLVFNHLSTEGLMEHSLREMGRVLKIGGHAVFGIQTMTRKGEIAGWLRRLVRACNREAGSRHDAIRSKLAALHAGDERHFSEDEILGDMFHMEFRKLKSIGLRRLRTALRASRLRVRRMSRNRTNGATLIAADKVS